ncbi:E3 ubiquitin-protein ligase TRAIP-like [Colletes gigas]|uniref:E3 ubiquitin-protein ligase TRAIP-like n=1 Tax=Colletes gigas TaxID=935657 RepID=UPI001C9BB2E4|nr:E3 ubiquitin-protein ligase TRAIP-like [Colletes gigas]
MNIVCVICSDLLIPSDDVFYTSCGHIFHYACLNQWLERSKSCPQCRERTTLSQIRRIYFNFSNDDIKEDKTSLQHKIDNLNFQLNLQKKDVNSHLKKIKILDKQNTKLKAEVLKVESQLNIKASAIYGLKEQIEFYKKENLEVENLKKEIELLQKKIVTYDNIKTLLETSTEDIDEIASRTCDPNTLITYIAVMKREMTNSLNKRRELRSKVKSLQQEVTKVSMERNFLSEERVRRKQLEDDLMTCESEIIYLKNKLKDSEKKKSLDKQSNNIDFKSINKLNSNVKNVSNQNKVESTVNNMNIEESNINLDQGDLSKIETIEEYENHSPYLPVKSRGVCALKQSSQKRGATKFNSLGFTKKAKIDQSATNEQVKILAITYDGFGGHSKHDQFPNSTDTKTMKIRDDIIKSKRQKANLNNQKLGDFFINFM